RSVEQLQPDVLVVDVMMPGLSGLEVSRRVAEVAPHTNVVVVSMYANEAYVMEAIQSGAKGYVLKNSTQDELIPAVRKAAIGRRYISEALADTIEAYMKKAKDGIVSDSYEMLSNREREVLHLAAEGLTNAEIANRLFLSPRTIEDHRSSMMHKLGLRTHIDLVRFALRRGIIPMDI
ncbi:MAG: response regulator transcription factor, partial [Chloroflexi bacterium]|nr:response regulator transcription factor [Chloroflexota bacterium]